ncbi:MAG: hypothetical protein HOK65_03275 [Crocinitomicaceae bacterium]|nr:hypothetical protein [Crocinitomicaceae bacterium]
MTSKVIYHISNGISLLILIAYSMNLVWGWAGYWAINLIYIIVPVIVVNQAFRFWAKKLDSQVINPIIAIKTARILYYSGAIIFILATISMMLFLPLTRPLVLLSVAIEIAAWVCSIGLQQKEKFVNSEIIDDLEL